MGNRLFGHDERARGKSYLTICRKVYLLCYHLFIVCFCLFVTVRCCVRKGNFDIRGTIFLDSGKPPARPTRQVKKKSAVNYLWAIKAFVFSFAVSVMLILLSNEVMDKLSIAVSVVVLFIIVAVGIAFDSVGVAVTKADEKPFHSMSARRIKSAKLAVNLIRNADKVSSICNDIVGDISGVISGAIATAVGIKLFGDDTVGYCGKLLFTALISAVIVGGKAAMKGVAMKYSNDIVNISSKIFGFFYRKK